MLLKEIHWVDNDRDCDLYLRAFLQLKRKGSEGEHSFYYKGIVNRHLKECVDPGCRCKAANETSFDNMFAMMLIE